VHHFCPSGLQQIAKNIVFVVDTIQPVDHARSKLDAVKTALNDIVEELEPEDMFNIVTYSSTLTHWNTQGVVHATSVNIHSAQSFINSIHPSTGLHTFLYFLCNYHHFPAPPRGQSTRIGALNDEVLRSVRLSVCLSVCHTPTILEISECRRTINFRFIGYIMQDTKNWLGLSQVQLLNDCEVQIPKEPDVTK